MSLTSILVVEDNEDDVFLMRRALRKAEVNVAVHIAVDGQQAKDYLAGTGQYGNRTDHPLPSLIFLDLKLPYVHGLEVLAWMRVQSGLKEIPVVILTSSSEERDRRQAFELGVRAYLVKPPTPEMVVESMRLLK